MSMWLQIHMDMDSYYGGFLKMDTKGFTKQEDFGWFGGTPMDWKAPYVIQECELSNSALPVTAWNMPPARGLPRHQQ